MTEKKFIELNEYLNFLQEHHNLHISIHGKAGFINKFSKHIQEHYIHSNPYCMCIKSKKNLWDKCIDSQDKVLTKCSSGMYFGMCYAGVEEYVIPVLSRGIVVAFLSLSGYHTNDKKALRRIKHLAKEYGANEKELQVSYYASLSESKPDKKFVRAAINVAVRLLEQIAEECMGDLCESLSTEDYIYSHIIAYIKQNYSNQIKVKDISSFCHCSESYINHIFKRKSGENINNYINSLRIEKAKNLLSTTKLSVKEISSTTGFNDSNYFSTVFKRHCNLSPRDYRCAYSYNNAH